jgi:hypothetical protein
MNQNNRVLGRVGARELMLGEIEHVKGGIIPRTNTACTINANGQVINDVGECGGGGGF